MTAVVQGWSRPVIAGVIIITAAAVSACRPAVSEQPGRVIGKDHVGCPWVKILHDQNENPLLRFYSKGCIDEARWRAIRPGDRWPPKAAARKER